MKCVSPVTTHRGVFPCGKCSTCNSFRRRVRLHRLMLERCFHSFACSVTLTCAHDFARAQGLTKKDMQKFLKRLRWAYHQEFPDGFPLKYDLVTEYGLRGDNSPHAHAIIFGLIECQLGPVVRLPGGAHRCDCVSCRLLRSAWPYGFITNRSADISAMAYVASHQVKALHPDAVAAVRGRTPPFRLSSRGTRGDGGLARRAATLVACALGDVRSNGGPSTVPTMLRHGRKLFPLGRFMREKIATDLGDRVLIPRPSRPPLVQYRGLSSVDFARSQAQEWFLVRRYADLTNQRVSDVYAALNASAGAFDANKAAHAGRGAL